MKFLLPKIIQEWRAVWREGGFRLLIRKKGWKIVVAFLVFYLIRDTLLYLVIPYFAVRGILSCPTGN